MGYMSYIWFYMEYPFTYCVYGVCTGDGPLSNRQVGYQLSTLVLLRRTATFAVDPWSGRTAGRAAGPWAAKG